MAQSSLETLALRSGKILTGQQLRRILLPCIKVVLTSERNVVDVETLARKKRGLKAADRCYALSFRYEHSAPVSCIACGSYRLPCSWENYGQVLNTSPTYDTSSDRQIYTLRGTN